MALLQPKRACHTLQLCSWPPDRAPEFANSITVESRPIYVAYLNRLEPWWKVLRSLALKGRRFDAWSEIEPAVQRATEYWNAHKHPFVWGRRRRHRIPRRLGIAATPNVIRV